MTSISKHYYTKNQIMEKFSISKNTLYRWYKNGLPYLKIGNVRLVHKQELEDWFQSKRVVSTEQSETISPINGGQG